MKAALLLLLLAGCADLDHTITLYAPSKICIAGDSVGCAELQKTLGELDAPSLVAQMCAAGADMKECRK